MLKINNAFNRKVREDLRKGRKENPCDLCG